tara:strand:+ start:236 stop:1021 length:786 start_codon:yes stop_codon:yes gene_type:complete
MQNKFNKETLIAAFELTKIINLVVLNNVPKISDLLELNKQEQIDLRKTLNQNINILKLLDSYKVQCMNLFLGPIIDESFTKSGSIESTNNLLMVVSELDDDAMHNQSFAAKKTLCNLYEKFENISSNTLKQKAIWDVLKDINVDILKNISKKYTQYSLATLFDILSRIQAKFIYSHVDESRRQEVLNTKDKFIDIMKKDISLVYRFFPEICLGKLNPNLVEKTIVEIDNNIDIIESSNISNFFNEKNSDNTFTRTESGLNF